MVNMGDDTKVTDMVGHSAFKGSFLFKKSTARFCKRAKYTRLKSDGHLLYKTRASNLEDKHSYCVILSRALAFCGEESLRL